MIWQKPEVAFCSILFVFRCFAPELASAQTELSLRQAMAQALQTNALLGVAQGRVEDARGQRWQAGLKPNPRLTVQSEDIRTSTPQLPFSFVNSTEDYLIVGQVIESAGKRQRRIEVASSVVQTTQFQSDLTRRQILGSVSAAYWAAASAIHSRDLLQENLRTYEEDVAYSRNRVREGVMAEADLMRIQLERDRMQAQVLAASRLADQATVELQRTIGQREFPPLRLTDSLEALSPVALPEIARVLPVHPEMLIARQAMTEAEANLRLQRANGKPDPEAFVGYKRNVGYDTLYGALQIDLPLRNRNQGNIASAEARLRIAQANLQATEARLRADLETAIRGYRDQRQLLDTLPASLARAQETERLARAAFREGGIDLLRLLDAGRSRIQTELDYTRALTEQRQALVNLSLASGADLNGGIMP